MQLVILFGMLIVDVSEVKLYDLNNFSCGMVHQGISRRALRDTTYGPGHSIFVEGDLA
jgi:hypothetical protein